MDIYGLFPIALGKFCYDKEITSELIEYFKGLKKRPNERNSTSDDYYILDRKPLADLKQFFMKSIIEYVKTIYDPMHQIKVRFTQSWVNYTENNEGHHYHTHPNSFISGVFYVQSDDRTGQIQFFNQFPPTLEISTNNFNDFNSAGRFMDATQGVLYLFPSFLPHSVQKNNSETLRISISFNTFLSGGIGEKNTLTELTI